MWKYFMANKNVIQCTQWQFYFKNNFNVWKIMIVFSLKVTQFDVIILRIKKTKSQGNHFLVNYAILHKKWMSVCDFRWLILSFKREFSFEEGLKLFEILTSQHLELNSLEAETQKNLQWRREFEQEGLLLLCYNIFLFCLHLMLSH